MLITIELLLESMIIMSLRVDIVVSVYLELPRRWSPYRLLPVPLVVAGDFYIVNSLSKDFS